MARFSYYDRLTRAQKAIYRRSDAVTALPLPDPAALRPLLPPIETALAADDRRAIQRTTAALCRALCETLQVPAVTLRVLARRPANAEGELHGLYECDEGERAIIRVWMRTAAHERPVAFRTFVRTVLHELCHHFDYEHLELADSYHTHGFFRRESSLARQLLPPSKRRRPETPPEPEPPGQLELPLS
jgi:hypothetical protein